MARRGYPAEFRRRVIDLVEGGRKVANFFNILGDLAGLGWGRGDAVVYRNGGGTSIGGMADGTTYFVTNATIVPEPSTATLMGLGLLAMGARSRRDSSRCLVD